MDVAKQMQIRKHIPEELCNCYYCMLIDIVFGDPLLSPWEQIFINSIARQGWERDYSPKQKTVLVKIYTRLLSERIKS